MNVITQIVKCSKCGRKMLVIRALVGVNHDAAVRVVCPNCTTNIDWDNDEWVKEHPEEAQELRNELEGD